MSSKFKEDDNFKRYCNTIYNREDKNVRVGLLEMFELEAAKNTLDNRKKLTDNQVKQLEAIKYFINYHTEKIYEKIYTDMHSRRIDKAYRIANLTAVWGEKIGKTIPKIENPDFNGKLKIYRKSNQRIEKHEKTVNIIKNNNI